MMDRIYRIIGVVLLLSLASCAEKPWREDEFKKAADQLDGFYEIDRARWEGEVVDLDNDGKASTDFMQEFADRIGEGKLYAQPITYTPDRSPGHCYYEVNIPFQKILREGGVDNSMNPSAVTARFVGRYTMNEKLEIVIDGPMLLRYISDAENFEDIGRLKDQPVLRLAGNGRLEISFNMTVYDYSTETWKTAPLTWYYKRYGY